MSLNTIILVGSTLLLISVVIGRVGMRFGIPSLFLFLVLGMLFGSDGLGVEFQSPEITQAIGVIALSVILFSGGMSTNYNEIKPVLGRGLALSTLGVLLTTVFVGLFIHYITNYFHSLHPFNFTESFLLAAVMSSTDSASVFSILRSNQITLRERIRPTLELESGSNDPMAYMLTLFFINVMTLESEEVVLTDAILLLLQQTVLGLFCGIVLGLFAVWLVNKVKVVNQAMYPILLVAFVFLTYSLTDCLQGNGYLAVYLAGLVVGNHSIKRKRNVIRFFDGFTWLFQIMLFLTLGLLVNPSDLIPVSGYGLLIGFFLILVGRPLSVLITLLPFRKLSLRAKLYISWVGLRGAVPIIFATYPLLNNLTNGSLLFNVVFFCTLLSLLVQGTTITYVAKWLKVGQKQVIPKSHFEMELTEEIKTLTSEVVVTASMLEQGDTLTQIDLPASALVVMIKRGDAYLIPRGATQLVVGDRLLIITDNEVELTVHYKRHNVNDYTIKKQ